ncbi:MAG: 50S ribosomal protein L29 [Patescibacteria group bacterium]|nr:50S ribosomal protein L29 [Patescibacteria group bacterium]
MKIKELKIKSENELKTLLKNEQEKLRELNFKVAQRQLKNIRELRFAKKNIAQISTLLKTIK